jgi:hypothetical protein
MIVGDISSLPINQNDFSSGVNVWLSSFSQFSFFDCQLIQEIFSVSPICDSVDLSNKLFAFD